MRVLLCSLLSSIILTALDVVRTYASTPVALRVYPKLGDRVPHPRCVVEAQTAWPGRLFHIDPPAGEWIPVNRCSRLAQRSLTLSPQCGIEIQSFGHLCNHLFGRHVWARGPAPSRLRKCAALFHPRWRSRLLGERSLTRRFHYVRVYVFPREGEVEYGLCQDSAARSPRGRKYTELVDRSRAVRTRPPGLQFARRYSVARH